jgi:hypothetical protein
MARRTPPARLVDLHVKWLWQYAPEVSLYDPAVVAAVPGRLPQVAGYLSDTAAAVVMLGGWPAAADPWAALAEDLARLAAEFCGRLLRDPADAARWRAEGAGGLAWATPGVAGLDRLVRTPDDLDRLPAALDRLRVVQLAPGPDGPLADGTGLTPLGAAALDALARAGTAGRPVAVELAGLAPPARRAVRDRLGPGLVPLYCEAAAPGPDPAPLPAEDAAWIASAGGLVAARPGSAVPPGGALATNFLGRDLAPGEPADAEGVLRWAADALDPAEAPEVVAGRAGALLARLAGASGPA